jgi:hypothetical protein
MDKSSTKFTFIHPTKCGGTAIENYINQHYKDYFINNGHTNVCTKDNKPIIVIREPYDRFISIFNYWKNGIQLWHQMEYYPNKRIKEYLYYDPIGRPIFRREYDDTGNFIDEGKMVPQLVMVNEKSSIFNREDTLVVRICHVDPPNTSNTVKIRILGLVDNWETIEPIDEFFPKVYKTVLNKKGVYTLEVKFQIKEDKNPEFREFTNNVEFTVE